eukprot:TRINITY_DN10590_c0_g4_i1.p1 TRINITY_DN10590_c0_g4~~TRINITY_DN10590_c0_g4_i1.p1  ORF type:complete len:434 (+),score=70.86 TRINITY_DN10590_c0_g4_i1:45-1346(+)
MATLHRFLLLLATIEMASGHAAMTSPKPRNSLDGSLSPWTNWSYPCDSTHQGDMCAIGFCEDGKNCQGSCAMPARDGIPNSLTASNGQSCYWFSNGCTVGCDECDGTVNHVGHGQQQFLYKGMDQATVITDKVFIPDPFNPPVGDMLLDPKSLSGLSIKPGCDKPNGQKATICNSSLRTANTQAECGSPEDYYFYSPWRAPGSAPVIDACGMAGGRFPGQGTGGAGAQYQNTSLAKRGDQGSHLPAMPPQATWKVGASYEVSWTVAANHGGGYAYRLAPADGPLTEESFRKMALDFVGKSTLRWDSNKSTDIQFDTKLKGWETNQGTTPAGSTWRKNPIPSGLWQREGPTFDPVCQESQECIQGYSSFPHLAPQGTCKCSGFSNGGPLLPNLEVVDSVQLPAGLAPGKYVLQWRWDCEESDQIWASCSDVEIV